MPETWFRVRWPDASTQVCYSPSSVVREHFAAGASYPVEEFLARSRRALDAAGERVRLKYGYACARARGELAAIESAARRYADSPGARVSLEGFQEQAFEEGG